MNAQLEFDIVIAGGGTSGCVLAGRLAAAEPSLSILVLEAGPGTKDDLSHVQPARFMYHLRPESTTMRFHVGRPSAALRGRAPIVPCGQCVGGGSSVNFSMYTRASASDYDDWADEWGNDGWGYKDLLPMLRKCETYQLGTEQTTHGYSGPLKISYGGYFGENAQDFLEVAPRYDLTRSSTADDVNNMHRLNVYGRWHKWINIEDGHRSDVAHNYIYNLGDAPNLRIVTGAQVRRVIVENKKAVGIEFLRSSSYTPDAKATAQIARAKKLVVLAAGAFGSPAILERSGIGSRAVMERLRIPQIVDLPGVGENYMDHQVIFINYFTRNEIHTWDKLFGSDKAEIAKWEVPWKENGKGALASNGIDVGIKLRPSADELKEIGPVFSQRWKDFYQNKPDKSVLWSGMIATYYGLPENKLSPEQKYFALGWFPMHPAVSGFTHITSAMDPTAPLDFHPGYLDKPEDMALHVWAYKRSREIARRMRTYRGENAVDHPAFAKGSDAACGQRDGPVAVGAPDIVYNEEDERAIEEYVRKVVATSWHSIGTCGMKRREEGGVVDSRLNVYGVEGLKVVDGSICPSNVGANTYSTAVVIGEKAATIVAAELGVTLL